MRKKKKNLAESKPHDAYFKAVFSFKEVAQQFIQYALPSQILNELNLDSLETASDSFVDEKLKESLSDLVYTCRRKTIGEVRICVLFEHKSSKPGRELYPQLNRYLVCIQEEDIKQNRSDFTLTIPILFYHGKEKWKAEDVLAFYGDISEHLKSLFFIPLSPTFGKNHDLPSLPFLLDKRHRPILHYLSQSSVFQGIIPRKKAFLPVSPKGRTPPNGYFVFHTYSMKESFCRRTDSAQSPHSRKFVANSCSSAKAKSPYTSNARK